MSDLESYVNHCYDLMLNQDENKENQKDEELCACSKLVARETR